jgi:hypothetical protein
LTHEIWLNFDTLIRINLLYILFINGLTEYIFLLVKATYLSLNFLKANLRCENRTIISAPNFLVKNVINNKRKMKKFKGQTETGGYQSNNARAGPLHHPRWTFDAHITYLPNFPLTKWRKGKLYFSRRGSLDENLKPIISQAYRRKEKKFTII